MNVVAWILQVSLAAQFLLHGWLYVNPPAALVGPMAAMGISTGFRQFIGVAEILASIGLVLPSLTRILPWLTPLAALGLVMVTVSAIIFHISRNELPIASSIFNLLLPAAITAYVRWKVVPIRSRAAQ